MSIKLSIYEKNITDIEKWVKENASKLVVQLPPPEQVGGVPFAELQAAVRDAAMPGDGERNCFVYLIVTPDFTKGRVGEGQKIRPVEQLVSYFWHEGPKDWQDREWAIKARTVKQSREKWKNQAKETRELIRDSKDRVYYIVVADGLTKAQSKAGERAMFNKLGPWLVNPRRR